MPANAISSAWASPTTSSSASSTYIRAVAAPGQDLAASLDGIKVYLYRDENFADTAGADELKLENGQWKFKVEGTGFDATLGITVGRVEA